MRRGAYLRRPVIQAVEALDPACVWEAGEVVGVYDSRLSLDGCEIPEGVTISVQVIEVTPVVVRVMLTEHPACERSADERDQLRRLRRKAERQARKRWGDGFALDVEHGACASLRRVDVDVVETR